MIQFRRVVALLFIGASVGGCGGHFPLTVSTNKPLTAKPANCDFQVAALPPQGAWEEIGTLTSKGAAIDNPEDFKAAVRAEVCRVGGDVVVTEVNGFGQYVRGTVVRKVP